jgi:hypothetical protein
MQHLTSAPVPPSPPTHIFIFNTLFATTVYTHSHAHHHSTTRPTCPPPSGRVDVDKEDWPKVDDWINTCINQLTASLHSLKTFSDLGGVAAVTGSSGSDAAAAAAGYSKSRPYYARVVSVEGLCVLRYPDDKDTVKVELELEPAAVSAGGLCYSPGDALGIWPSNPPQVRGGGEFWGGGAGGEEGRGGQEQQWVWIGSCCLPYHHEATEQQCWTTYPAQPLCRGMQQQNMQW